MTNSRTKGKTGELEAAKLLRHWFPDCKRGIGQSRDGAEMPDLINTGPYWTEVKRYNKIWPSLISKWWYKLDQECALNGAGLIPLLMYRGNNTPWRVRLVNDGKVVDVAWEVFAKACDKRFKEVTP